MNLIKYFRSYFTRKDEIAADMKYLIVGLGNMGADYDHTRHNVGFDVVDALAEAASVSFKHEQLGDVAQYKHRGRQIYLLKPSTYMNLSGKAVRYWVQKLKIQPNNWLVVVDELQFDVGVFKLQKKGGPGSHNGLKSVQDIMQTSNYPRLRVGIGSNFHRGQQVDYVLGKWKQEEWEQIEQSLPAICDTIHAFASIGIDRAMTQYNKKKSPKTPSQKG